MTARTTRIATRRGGAMLLVTAGALLGAALATTARADEDRAAAGKRAFLDVVRVLQSPRCVNCHPKDDRPRVGDNGRPHPQNISRKTVAAGVPCSACHQDRNAEAVGVEAGPPGARHWGLPPAETPMVFQDRTPAELCAQLKDPARNGHRSLAQLLEHVSGDPLVLWGWAPGGNRTPPPVPHAQFVDGFSRWVAAKGACP